MYHQVMHERAAAILTASAALMIAACDPLGARAEAERARAELLAAEAEAARAKADATIEKLTAELVKAKEEAEKAKAEAAKAKAECAGSGSGSGSGAIATATAKPSAGGLEKSQIQSVIRAHTAEIRGCYNKSLLKDPKLAGKVVVKFTIAADGSVSESVSSKSDVSEALTGCIVDTAKTWRFPAPGEQVVVSYPFVLKPS